MSAPVVRRLGALAAMVLVTGITAIPATDAAPLAGAAAPRSAVTAASDVPDRVQKPRLTVTPAVPMLREQTVFSGKSRGSGKAVLQRKAGKKWKAVAKAKIRKNRYRVKARLAKPGKYRVLAAGRTTKAVQVGFANQSSMLLPKEVPFVVGVDRTVVAVTSPARTGRTIALQALVGGAWETVASAPSGADGTATLRFRGTTPGATDYRVIADAFQGAAASPPSASVSIRTARPTELASTANTVGGDASYADVSADGRWVAFASNAQLLPADNDAFYDIYLLDRATGALSAILLHANNHMQSPSLSGDGRYVAFQSEATNLGSGSDAAYDVFVLDRASNGLELVSHAMDLADANGVSTGPTIADDGRFVTFISTASNLIPAFQPPDTGTRHAWFYNRATKVHRVLDRAGVAWSNNNVDAVTINGSGTRVAFDSGNDALDPGDVSTSTIFTTDVSTDGTLSNRVNRTGPDVIARDAHLDGDGSVLAFDTPDGIDPGDSNGDPDVYLLTISSGVRTMVSPIGGDSSRVHGVSADGRYVLFTTRNQLPGDTNGIDDDVVIWDSITGTRTLVTAGANASSLDPAMSADGAVVAYSSKATNIVSGSTGESNVFVEVVR